MAAENKFRRILLKLSGEGLMGKREFGLDADTVDRICQEICDVHSDGVEICIVIGAGNIFRGVAAAIGGMDRSSADYMGMLATTINALALALNKENFGTLLDPFNGLFDLDQKILRTPLEPGIQVIQIMYY